jgi:hypothetical protein
MEGLKIWLAGEAIAGCGDEYTLAASGCYYGQAINHGGVSAEISDRHG